MFKKTNHYFKLLSNLFVIFIITLDYESIIRLQLSKKNHLILHLNLSFNGSFLTFYYGIKKSLLIELRMQNLIIINRCTNVIGKEYKFS